MSKTNCINCGAAKDTSEIKCPFCGTTYLDLTAIDFGSDDPVVCEFVLPKQFGFNGLSGRVVMSTLAIPHLENITMEDRRTNIYGGIGGHRLTSVSTGMDINIGVSFTPVAKGTRKEICTLRVLEDGT